MSSDLKEVKRLKEVLCRKKVSQIKKKYHKAEKKVCKKIFEDYNYKDYDFLLKSRFIEFRKRYFSKLYKNVNDLVNNYIGSLEGEMQEYIDEIERNRSFEVIALVKSILDRNCILWALFDDYIECKKKCICPEVISLIVCEEHKSAALNIFNVLGVRDNEGIYDINSVKIRLFFAFTIDDNMYNLTNDNIKYCPVEDEELPILKVY